MTIKANIEGMMQRVRENGDGKAIGISIQKRAVQAIKGGEGSDEWRNYMELFAETPAQLARLLPTDDTLGNEEMDIARTYLLGNGTCGAETTGFQLIFGVDERLDRDLVDEA